MYSGGLNWRGFSPGSAQAFALATFLVVIASLMRWGIGLITDEVQGFATYYPAVLFAALVGGVAVGIFAVVLGGVISWWAFLTSVFRIFISHFWTSNQLTHKRSPLCLLCGRQTTIAGLRSVSKMKRIFVIWPSKSSHTD